ncbi:MAG: hypothetical protein ABIO46_16030 [Chitinophagales bacterium]
MIEHQLNTSIMITPSFHHKIAEFFLKVANFCFVFEKQFAKRQLPAGSDIRKRNRNAGLCDSEVISLLIGFHDGQFRNFKHFYTRHRSISGYLLDIMGAIAAYSFFPKKPSIKHDIEESNPILIQQFKQELMLVA